MCLTVCVRECVCACVWGTYMCMCATDRDRGRENERPWLLRPDAVAQLLTFGWFLGGTRRLVSRVANLDHLHSLFLSLAPDPVYTP